MKAYIKTALLAAGFASVLGGCEIRPHAWFGIGADNASTEVQHDANDSAHKEQHGTHHPAAEAQPDANESAAEAAHGVYTAGSREDAGTAVAGSESPPAEVTVELMGTRGTPIGKAKLTAAGGGVHFDVAVAYLPQGSHGFHVHENGKCESPEFQSAGGHFNPDGKKHGARNPHGPHAGDLPNLQAGSDGKATLAFDNKLLTLEKDKPNSLLKPGGTSLVIHEKADDYSTDPSGSSGARIACAVIQ